MNYKKLPSGSLLFIAVISSLCQAISCASSKGDSLPGNRSEGLATGQWAGEHIVMQVDANGAKVEFDCAHGTINQRIVSDRDGRFDVAGSYAQEAGGPEIAERPAPERPARYAGRVEGKILAVKITLTDTGEEIGSFTLTHGRVAMLTKCY